MQTYRGPEDFYICDGLELDSDLGITYHDSPGNPRAVALEIAKRELDEIDFSQGADDHARRVKREEHDRSHMDSLGVEEEPAEDPPARGTRSKRSQSKKGGDFSSGGVRVTRPSQKPGSTREPAPFLGSDAPSEGRLHPEPGPAAAESVRLLSGPEALENGPLPDDRGRAEELAALEAKAKLPRWPGGTDLGKPSLGTRKRPTPKEVAERDRLAELVKPRPVLPPIGPPRPRLAQLAAAGVLECDCTCHARPAAEGPYRAWADYPEARCECAPACGSCDAAGPIHRAVSLPCGCGSAAADTCLEGRFGPRVLGVKVDTLHLSVFCHLDPDWLEELEGKKLDAQAHEGESHVMIGRVKFLVCVGGGGPMYRYKLSSELGDVLVSRATAEDVPALRFELRSVFLWNAEMEGVWKWCEELATGLHTPRPHGSRCATLLETPGRCDCGGKNRKAARVRVVVTRSDLCADVMGVDLGAATLEEFVLRARTRTRHAVQSRWGWLVEAQTPRTLWELVHEAQAPAAFTDSHEGRKGAALNLHVLGDAACGSCDGTGRGEPTTAAEHRSGLHTSGFSFGRSEINFRIYDKAREIREKSRDKAWLWEIWAENGWVCTEQVWRSEGELRREGLRELADERTLERLDLDSMEGFREALPSLWGYLVGGVSGHVAWIKWAVPCHTGGKKGHRSRWDVQEGWRTVQQVDWKRGQAHSLVRRRRRSAKFHILLAQNVGVGLTLAAAAGTKTDGSFATIADLADVGDVFWKSKGRGSWQDRVAERAVMLNAEEAVERFTAELSEARKAAKAENLRRASRSA